MSLTSTAKHTSTNWIPLIAWTQVTLGTTGFLAVATTPATGVVAGLLVALVGLAVHALAKASRKMDRIFTEELDR